jgi:hypothetical protein
MEEFESWPDGPVIMRPNPVAGDVAITRVTRHASPEHPAAPTAAHAAWEAAQRRWAAVASEADADEAAEAAAAAAAAAGQPPGSYVPAPGGGIPLNQYLIHFESDLFVGKMLVYIRGLPSSHEPYFAGKRRRSVLMIQVGPPGGKGGGGGGRGARGFGGSRRAAGLALLERGDKNARVKQVHPFA